MTILSSVACDSPECTATYDPPVPTTTAGDARNFARDKAAWHLNNGKDICDACWKTGFRWTGQGWVQRALIPYTPPENDPNEALTPDELRGMDTSAHV